MDSLSRLCWHKLLLFHPQMTLLNVDLAVRGGSVKARLLFAGRNRQVGQIQQVLVAQGSAVSDARCADRALRMSAATVVTTLNLGGSRNDLFAQLIHLLLVEQLHLIELISVVTAQIFDGDVHGSHLLLEVSLVCHCFDDFAVFGGACLFQLLL